MTNTIPHDHRQLRPHAHHQEMDQLQALAVKPQAVKRQARRRTHTSRPYQERLLNMAEARREIVTALKIHRASSSTRQHQRSTHQQQQVLQQQQEEEKQLQVQAAADEEASLAHTTMSYAAAAAAASFANNPLCSSPPMQWIAGSYCSPSPSPILRLPYDLTPHEVLPHTAAMGGLVELEHYQGGLERLVRSLPAQPLGLNLSFQGFGVSVDDGAKDDCEDLYASLPLAQPSPAASYSYSPPAVETATTHAYGHGSPALSAADAENHSVSVIDAPSAALVPVLDGGEMKMVMTQASNGGEMQGVEYWSEAAAADVAAWWSKIFESVESEQHAPRPNAEDVAGLPAEWRWLCGDDVGVGEQGAITVTRGEPTPDVLGLGTMMHVDDGDGDYSCCYEGGRSDDGEDVTLPRMDDIGDTKEGWNGDGSHALD